MTNKVWPQTTQEFIIKWADRKDLDIQDIGDMISDLLSIIGYLEKIV